MDWWEILYTFVGSFLGFGFAILAEEFFEHQKDRNDRKKLKHNLFDELGGIAVVLSDHIEESVPIIFDTPVWNSVIATGILLALLEYDENLYDQIMMIYNRLYILQIAEREYSKNFSLIKQLRYEIIEDIDNLKILEIKEGDN